MKIGEIQQITENSLKELASINPDLIFDFSSAESGVNVTDSGDRYKVDICFSGLTLDDKILIENTLKAEFSGKVNAYINFKRPESELSTPSATPKPDSPFGLDRKPQKISGVKNILVVSSGKGGVGKSTVSSNLAVCLAELGQRVGYLDADIYGPSGGLMFGLNAPPNVSKDNKLVPQESHGVKVASFGTLSDPRTPVIWRGPMIARGFEQLCFQVEWGQLDYLIIDLPPGTGDIQLTMLEKLDVDAAVVVTTPQDMALIDATKAYSMFKKLGLRVLGLVENMKTHTCSNCGHEEAIFGDNAKELADEIGLLGELPLNIEIRKGADQGEPIGITNNEIGRKFQSIAKLVHEKI